MNRLIRHTARCLLSAGVLTLGGLSVVSVAVAGDPAPVMGTAPIDTTHVRNEAIKIEVALLRDPTTFTLPVTVGTRGDVIEVHGAVPSPGLRDHVLRLARRSSYLSVEDRMTVAGSSATTSATSAATEMTTGQPDRHAVPVARPNPVKVQQKAVVQNSPAASTTWQPARKTSLSTNSARPLDGQPPQTTANHAFTLSTHGDTEVHETPLRHSFATAKQTPLATRNEPPVSTAVVTTQAIVPDQVVTGLAVTGTAPGKPAPSRTTRPTAMPPKPANSITTAKAVSAPAEVVPVQATETVEPTAPAKSAVPPAPVVKSKPPFPPLPVVKTDHANSSKLLVNGTQTVATLPSGLPPTRVVAVQVNSVDRGNEYSHSVLYVVPGSKGSSTCSGYAAAEAEGKKSTLWGRICSPFRSDDAIDRPQVVTPSYSSRPSSLNDRTQPQAVQTVPAKSPRIQTAQAAVATPSKTKTTQAETSAVVMTINDVRQSTAGPGGKAVPSWEATGRLARVGSTTTANPQPMPVGPAVYSEPPHAQPVVASGPSLTPVAPAIYPRANPQTPYQSRPLSYQRQLHEGQPSQPAPIPQIPERPAPVLTSRTSTPGAKTTSPSRQVSKVSATLSQTSASSQEASQKALSKSSSTPSTVKATTSVKPATPAKAPTSSVATVGIKQTSASSPATLTTKVSSNQAKYPPQPLRPTPPMKTNSTLTAQSAELVRKVKRTCGKFATSVHAETGADGMLALHVYAAAGAEQTLTTKLFDVPELTASNIRLHVHVNP